MANWAGPVEGTSSDKQRVVSVFLSLLMTLPAGAQCKHAVSLIGGAVRGITLTDLGAVPVTQNSTCVQAIEYWRAEKASGDQERFTANADDWVYNDLDMTHIGEYGNYMELIGAIKNADDWQRFDGVEVKFGTISMQEDDGPYLGWNNETRLLTISLYGQNIVDFSFTGDTQHRKGQPTKDHDIANIQCDGKHFKIRVQTLATLKVGLELAAANPEQNSQRRAKFQGTLEEIAVWDIRFTWEILLSMLFTITLHFFVNSAPEKNEVLAPLHSPILYTPNNPPSGVTPGPFI